MFSRKPEYARRLVQTRAPKESSANSLSPSTTPCPTLHCSTQSVSCHAASFDPFPHDPPCHAPVIWPPLAPHVLPRPGTSSLRLPLPVRPLSHDAATHRCAWQRIRFSLPSGGTTCLTLITCLAQAFFKPGE